MFRSLQAARNNPADRTIAKARTEKRRFILDILASPLQWCDF
jgi:hypothetical protein